MTDAAIGWDVLCPRDGRLGCALVDWLPREHRREQTHFMSWTWRYTLSQVKDALEAYSASMSTTAAAGNVYFFMCFFTNNQFRIIVEETTAGSADLEEVFEANLRRIGRMVAILDTWDRPIYLSRVWTVYEQFVASTLQVPVSFVMPPSSIDQLRLQLSLGSTGIDHITRSISSVDSERAEAWKAEDERKVKSLIQQTVGFQHVNSHVAVVMSRWIGDVMQNMFRELIDNARTCQVEPAFWEYCQDELLAVKAARFFKPALSIQQL